MNKKIVRTATVAMSLDLLLKGQLKFLNKHYEVIAVSGDDKFLKNVESREKVETFSIVMEREISIFKDLASLIKLYLFFKKEKPYIVHSITPKAGLLSMIAAYFAGVPIRIHTFTGLIFPNKIGLFQKLLILMDRLLCRFATHVYPEGEGVKRDLIRYKITDKPLRIIANGNINGIDTAFFDPSLFPEKKNASFRKNLTIDDNDFVFIFVGRLVADKGINELVRAFDKLSDKYDNVSLLLVGNFEEELDPLLPESIAIIQNNKAIVSVGFQDDVRPYFAISNALVFPSYREGFPNVVLQAGAMNLPSIVSDINGCNEIIEKGKNGIIIPVKDENAIFESMKRLSQNDELTNQLKKNCRDNIVSKFEQKIVWEAILNEYHKLENVN